MTSRRARLACGVRLAPVWIDDPALRDLATAAFTSEMYERMDVDKTLDDAVYQLRLAKLEEKRAAVQQMLSNGEMDMMDENEFAYLLRTKSDLDKEILELKGEMEVKDNK